MSPQPEGKTHAPSVETVARAHVDSAKYEEMYAASLNDPEAFWGEHGKRIDWIKPFTTVKDVNYNFGEVSINWFADGTLNVSANCIDRHLDTRGDQTAIIFEPDDPNEAAQHITYNELHRRTCRMANILETMGDLSADDPRSRLCDAGLCPYRCHPFDCFCRLQP
jgi:acetyl-CoA synthetase